MSTNVDNENTLGFSMTYTEDNTMLNQTDLFALILKLYKQNLKKKSSEKIFSFEVKKYFLPEYLLN